MFAPSRVSLGNDTFSEAVMVDPNVTRSSSHSSECRHALAEAASLHEQPTTPDSVSAEKPIMAEGLCVCNVTVVAGSKVDTVENRACRELPVASKS